MRSEFGWLKSFHLQFSSVWQNFQKQIPDMPVQLMGMSPEDRSVPHSGRPRTLKCLWSRLVLALTAFRVVPASIFLGYSASPNPKVSLAQAHNKAAFWAYHHPTIKLPEQQIWYFNFTKIHILILDIFHHALTMFSEWILVVYSAIWSTSNGYQTPPPTLFWPKGGKKLQIYNIYHLNFSTSNKFHQKK